VQPLRNRRIRLLAVLSSLGAAALLVAIWLLPVSGG
jgi:hypothetical protein